MCSFRISLSENNKVAEILWQKDFQNFGSLEQRLANKEMWMEIKWQKDFQPPFSSGSFGKWRKGRTRLGEIFAQSGTRPNLGRKSTVFMQWAQIRPKIKNHFFSNLFLIKILKFKFPLHFLPSKKRVGRKLSFFFIPCLQGNQN